ncbi:MAG: hypothetical protein AAF934_00105 [Bacteroidota bacterium]
MSTTSKTPPAKKTEQDKTLTDQVVYITKEEAEALATQIANQAITEALKTVEQTVEKAAEKTAQTTAQKQVGQAITEALKTVEQTVEKTAEKAVQPLVQKQVKEAVKKAVQEALSQTEESSKGSTLPPKELPPITVRFLKPSFGKFKLPYRVGQEKQLSGLLAQEIIKAGYGEKV